MEIFRYIIIIILFHVIHSSSVHYVVNRPKAIQDSLVVPVISSSLPGHKSLDEDVNEYLSFRSVEASSCLNLPGGLAIFLSFKTRH